MIIETSESEERALTGKTRIRGALAGTFAALIVALALAGCGSGTAASPTPSATPSPSGIAGSLLALKTYLGQVQPILSRVSTTVGTLPDAVKGLSKKPDSTWTASATRLDDIAAQLSSEAASLAALTPPSALQSLQDAVVKTIKAAQAPVAKLAGALSKGVATAATAQSKVTSTIDSARALLQGASTQLNGAIGSLLGSPSPTPAP